jgi:glycosyltransferase involved in cell wall biosynthesis
LKVGLNATCFNDRPSGARQRFVGLCSELVRCFPDAEFVVYEPRDCRVGSWFDGAPNVTTRCTPIPSEGRVRKFFGGLGYWHAALPGERFDLFEGFHLPLVKAPTGRSVLTIHDIRGVHPGNPLLERVAYRAFIGRSLRSADHVITVSEAMKTEILGFYPEIPISVIRNGLDSGRFAEVPEPELLAIRQKLSLPENFILAVGHLESRKNYPRLIDAIALLRDRGRSCFLLIVGNDSGSGKEIQERVEAAKLSNCVKLLSGLSDLEVRCVYRLCSLFVFPSSYEGFGIPVLEAMAASRPMVLSDLPVFREITQDQGVYFPYHDPELMANAIEMVLSSSKERQRLIEYGNERVKAFSFRSLAKQLERLYRSLL